MTSFEDNHYFCFSDTFMAYNLYSGFAIQNTCMSTAIISRMVLQRHYLLSAILLTSLYFCTTADFEIKYFFNEDIARFG